MICTGNCLPNWPKQKGPKERLCGAFWNIEQSNECNDMHKRDVNTHWIIQIPFLVMVNNVVQAFLYHLYFISLKLVVYSWYEKVLWLFLTFLCRKQGKGEV